MHYCGLATHCTDVVIPLIQVAAVGRHCVGDAPHEHICVFLPLSSLQTSTFCTRCLWQADDTDTRRQR